MREIGNRTIRTNMIGVYAGKSSVNSGRLVYLYPGEIKSKILFVMPKIEYNEWFMKIPLHSWGDFYKFLEYWS